tara:strand:+ start:621 stop:1019 length:399 start_codon:yes stop_codon:yes gene_type:complete
MTILNSPTERIVLIFECKVKDLENFKIWSKDRASKYVYDLKEESSISYEWHVSENGKEATLIESFVNSDAMMIRLGNHVASPLATEVTEHVEIMRVLCLGNVKKDAIEALTPWGTQFHFHHSGYNREVVGPR